MPYFLFAIADERRPEPLARAATYREAKTTLAVLRDVAARSTAMPAGARVRMVFAADEAAAAELLSTPREPNPAQDADDD